MYVRTCGGGWGRRQNGSIAWGINYTYYITRVFATAAAAAVVCGRGGLERERVT